MKKLNILILILFVFISCKKETIEPEAKKIDKELGALVHFKFEVNGFDIKKSTFKGLADDPTSPFIHQYPRNTIVLITHRDDNKKMVIATGDSTLETCDFGLPPGTYRISIEPNFGPGSRSTMYFHAVEQTIVITSATLSVPITIIPDCFLLLVADLGNLLLTEPSFPAIQYHGKLEYIPRVTYLSKYNNYLYYIYCTSYPDFGFSLTKKDMSYLYYPELDQWFETGYIYKILVLTGSPVKPTIVTTFEYKPTIYFY